MAGSGRLAVERDLKPVGIGLVNGRCQKLTDAAKPARPLVILLVINGRQTFPVSSCAVLVTKGLPFNVNVIVSASISTATQTISFTTHGGLRF